MSTRRQDVLAVLREAGTALSIAQIAGELAVHPNTARFHLEALAGTGQVEAVEADRAKPGRPPLMFRAVAGMDPAGPRDYRTLAGILADALARQPNAARRAVTAGRSWGEHTAEPTRTRSRRQAVDRLTDLLAGLGFAPEARPTAGGIGEIGLRNCPFLDLADTRRDVVCPVHLGLMQGALSRWKAPITVEALIPFAEPDLCVAHLAPAGRTS
ncbi:helix-turn-helix transcriptional regulator [Mycolicibacterium monacense]|uniref:Transcriptional regulator n=4 Tax=Mycobacteriaceae TaxID=1762 RepID=A0AAD1J1J3_MYCMB|nr:HTH domain-containing protein [Mycolicibacterium monacense]MDA4103381.1 transcriptional regulator [Mycolicibacterium monacense DSM 44395]OBB58910.1 transcriptional regulator [Mycolicibacterium monacense]OBF56513.1 transcriptional regulator [Mycolicibacterium monacense]ORB21101.1 transcriptional regulator [Mycolicibacterium monacense DSM 44395]QHP88971.1 transcriptional regulator [Mycolicibacterium monacense DSM 44395]